MATVASSEIVEDAVQIDERRRITEKHTTDDGRELFISYMAEKGADAEVAMNNRVLLIDEQLANESAQTEKQDHRDTAAEKLNAYIETLSDVTLTTVVGLTVGEKVLVDAGEVKVG